MEYIVYITGLKERTDFSKMLLQCEAGLQGSHIVQGGGDAVKICRSALLLQGTELVGGLSCCLLGNMLGPCFPWVLFS